MRIRLKEVKGLERFAGRVLDTEPARSRGLVVVQDNDPFIHGVLLWPDEYELVPVTRTIIRQEIYLGCGRAVLVREAEFTF